MFTRNCPRCNEVINYKREDNYLSAVRDDGWCKVCSALPATRVCPLCGDIITLSNRKNCIKAIRKKQPCLKCENELRKTRFLGERNPFFGKNHSEETKRKIGNQDQSYKHTPQFKQRRVETSKRGQDNPMYGKSVYELSLKKYGKEEADRRMDLAKQKWSIASSGERNPMFGKPSPQGAGNGWSGWYKDWYFRSLRELAYMVNVIEGEGKRWRSAETADLKIPYTDYAGRQRTYTADFLIDEKLLVEIKPSKLHGSVTVKTKQEAASRFCESKGLEYQLVDVPVLTDKEVTALYESGAVKFTSRYEALYRERYSKA